MPMRRLGAGGAKAPALLHQPLGNRHDLLGGLALTQNQLLMPLSVGPEVIDRRECQPLDEHVHILRGHAGAPPSASAKYAAKSRSASAIDSMEKRRCRSSEAPR